MIKIHCHVGAKADAGVKRLNPVRVCTKHMHKAFKDILFTHLAYARSAYPLAKSRKGMHKSKSRKGKTFVMLSDSDEALAEFS